MVTFWEIAAHSAYDDMLSLLKYLIVIISMFGVGICLVLCHFLITAYCNLIKSLTDHFEMLCIWENHINGQTWAQARKHKINFNTANETFKNQLENRANTIFI